MARTRLLVASLCALYLVGFSSGCLRLNANIDVQVDGSSAVDVQVAMSEALLSMGEGGEDPFAEMMKQPPPGDWKVEEFTEEGWKGVRIKGTAPLGSNVFPQPEGEAATPGQLSVIAEKRLFSTEYVVEGSFTPEAMGPPQEAGTSGEARLPEGRIIFTQATEQAPMPEFDPAALMGLMGAMGQGPSITFTLGLPGEIIETSGKINAAGKAEWSLGMAEMMSLSGSPSMELSARSVLMNQQSIGRLADKLAAECGLQDAAALVAAYVKRGMLPNPSKDSPLTAGLDASAYDAAISLCVALDDVLGPALAARVVSGLKLNADNVTARQLKDAWAAIGEIEDDELVEVGAQSVIKHIRMLHPAGG